jgi:uncharacterized membrane protein (UPF0127 family)
MKTVSTILVIVVSVGILFYIASSSVSLRAVPSLQEFIASSTEEQGARSSARQLAEGEGSGENFLASSSPYSILLTPSSKFRVTIAKTPSTREKGLSGRASLALDEGLLFIFPKPGMYPFWMKDMNFPIDIVWIDSTRAIVGISENISPETYPDSFSPPKNIQFVLEVNAGMAKSSGLQIGDVVSF